MLKDELSPPPTTPPRLALAFRASEGMSSTAIIRDRGRPCPRLHSSFSLPLCLYPRLLRRLLTNPACINMVAYLGGGITFPIARASDVIGAGIAFPVIGTILILLRLLANRMNKTKFDLSDLFGLLSWITIVGMGALFVWSADHGAMGYGALGVEVTRQQAYDRKVNIVQTEYFFLVLMIFALGTTKLSILFFFRRLFVTHRCSFWNYFTLALIVIVTAWTIAFVLAFALLCGGHASLFWDFEHPVDRQQTCLGLVSSSKIENACGSSDLMLDLLCILLPFPVVSQSSQFFSFLLTDMADLKIKKIWRLKLGLRQKLALTAIFMIGIMTIAASIARLVIWVEVDTLASQPNPDPTVDISLSITLALYWGMLETGLAFIASQMPALGTFLNKSTRWKIVDTIRSSSMSLRPLRSHRTENTNKHDLEG